MIEEALKKALTTSAREAGFKDQLQINREFHIRMERAGVTTRKQGFTIPLMERIVNLAK